MSPLPLHPKFNSDMKPAHFLFFPLLLSAATAAAQAPQDSLSADSRTPASVYFKDGKLHFSSTDDKFHLWLDNRIYVDAAYYSPVSGTGDLESKPNKDLEEDDGRFRFDNGASIRRARFAIKARLYEKWFSELDLDFAYNEVEIKDMFLGYQFNRHWAIQAGHFKEPMSMERLTSSKYLTAMERPMSVEAFAGGRRLGVAATGWGNHWWTSAGVFGQQVDIIQKEKNRGSDGYGFTARAAWSPINTDALTLHLGGYATYRTPDAGGTEDRLVEFRTFPESRTDRRRFVRAEIPNVNHYTTCGLEAGVRWNKLLAYGEYIFTDLSRYKRDGAQRKVSLKNATFNGWYATVSYMIRGGQRRYSPEDAEFGPLASVRRGGNLEVSARASHINLNDFHDASAVITGGSAYAYNASFNWYPVRNVLLGLNYTFMDNDKYADDKGHITKNGRPLSETMKGGLDFHILQMRLLVSF